MLRWVCVTRFVSAPSGHAYSYAPGKPEKATSKRHKLSLDTENWPQNVFVNDKINDADKNIFFDFFEIWASKNDIFEKLHCE